MDFDNVREVLEVLFDYNNQKNGVPRIKDDGARKMRDVKTEELQEVNYELLANVADLLGMSDLYVPVVKTVEA